MTVVAPQDRLSWKFTIPACLVFIGCVVALWLMPEMEPLPEDAWWLLRASVIWVNGALSIVKWISTVLAPLILFMLVSLSIWGDLPKDTTGVAQQR